MPGLQHLLIYLFFTTQLFLIVIGQLRETNYFNWVPYDEISLYEISVTVNGRELTEDEIQLRYRKHKFGRENRGLHNLISIVRQYETSYGIHDDSKIRINFLTNGYRKTTWSWPENTLVKK